MGRDAGGDDAELAPRCYDIDDIPLDMDRGRRAAVEYSAVRQLTLSLDNPGSRSSSARHRFARLRSVRRCHDVKYDTASGRAMPPFQRVRGVLPGPAPLAPCGGSANSHPVCKGDGIDLRDSIYSFVVLTSSSSSVAWAASMDSGSDSPYSPWPSTSSRHSPCRGDRSPTASIHLYRPCSPYPLHPGSAPPHPVPSD